MPKQRRWMAIHLGRLVAGRLVATYPDSGAETRLRANARVPSLFGLAPGGVYLPSTLLPMRCALTAPFHPCRVRRGGGLLSVALSLGPPPPAVNRHRVPVEPGLSSPRRGFPIAGRRPSDRLDRRHSRAKRVSGQLFMAATAAIIDRVRRSASPLTACGTKWRWKAVTTSSSSAPGS